MLSVFCRLLGWHGQHDVTNVCFAPVLATYQPDGLEVGVFAISHSTRQGLDARAECSLLQHL